MKQMNRVRETGRHKRNKKMSDHPGKTLLSKPRNKCLETALDSLWGQGTRKERKNPGIIPSGAGGQGLVRSPLSSGKQSTLPPALTLPPITAAYLAIHPLESSERPSVRSLSDIKAFISSVVVAIPSSSSQVLATELDVVCRS